MASIIQKPITKDEIELLKSPGLDYVKSDILCRMGTFSYLRSENDIRQALGNEWSHLEVWLDESIDNQGFATWSDNVVVVSFRGSNPTWGDWKKNATAFSPDIHALGGRRHNGFDAVWRQSEEKVLDILNNKINANSQLWLTGHSLGGAVATAASADFILRCPSKVADYHVMTFGAPRFGNEEFQRKYDSEKNMVDRHWFFANQRDPVPHLGPTWMGYRHAGTLKYFSKTGEHLNVSKKSVGLQASENTPDAVAFQDWISIDEEINKYSQTEEDLEYLVRQIMDDANNLELSLTEEGVQIEYDSLELQSSNLWSAKKHDTALYYERIHSVAYP